MTEGVAREVKSAEMLKEVDRAVRRSTVESLVTVCGRGAVGGSNERDGESGVGYVSWQLCT